MLYSGHLMLWCFVVVQCCWVKCVRNIDDAHVNADKKMLDVCNIYCNHKLLYHVQMAKIFNDSKYIVDMKLKKSPDEVENSFDSLLKKTKEHPNKDQLKKFIAENFDNPGTEFEIWIPEDWKAKPKFTNDVYDLPLRNWVREVNRIWKSLGRKLSIDVYENNSLYSYLYVPNPFIVPGGRFYEVYYWDSYWIIEGLLLSEMYVTAKGMIENFIYLVNQFGYIPNGNRKYYLGRSQPPFLTSMVDLYWKYTKDIKFLNTSISALEKEYSFWHKNRSVSITVDGRVYRLFQYRVITTNSRPESCYWDEELVRGMSKEEKLRVFTGIKSAAESGWDFSSRWFLANGEHTVNMTDIDILSIAPVCLNSLMGMNARLLSEYFEILGIESKHKMYKTLADEVNTTMSRIFWSDRDGMWLDYNVVEKKPIPGFYPSNLMPLWTETYGKERTPEFLIEQAIAYIDRNNISNYPGGVPTSLLESGQQWDLPNGWAPLQYIVVLGLHKARRYNPRAENLSFSLAQKWVLNVYQAYKNTSKHDMLEKYKVTEIGMGGGGGEYKTQKGFGWTNAVIMKFLSLYGHKIRTQDTFDPAPILVGIMLMVVSLVSIGCYMQRVHCYQKI
ncbi:trehalase-like isoform X1 [Panulirus ornatus]|uniref:trehalase-like isoform X1 n=1 Tax=Panulirus ornatus TaxID=150431 RepID=UPI003A83731B